MEENKNNNPQQQNTEKHTMSPFCEALMNVTNSLNKLRQPGDSAIIICSDGHTVAARTAGKPADAMEMIYSKMQNNQVFADVITEAARMYSLHQLEQHLAEMHRKMDEDKALANTATIQPLN